MTAPVFPRLSAKLARQLEAVEQTEGLYYPCCVTLKDGRELDHVFLAENSRWIAQWGIWPQDDHGKRSLDLNEVESLHSSPSRLPAKFAEQLYSEGESGMGYTIFTVVFADGVRQAYHAGNAIDFIRYPPGQGPQTVAAVFPHQGRAEPTVAAPEYYWCLYAS